MVPTLLLVALHLARPAPLPAPAAISGPRLLATYPEARDLDLARRADDGRLVWRMHLGADLVELDAHTGQVLAQRPEAPRSAR